MKTIEVKFDLNSVVNYNSSRYGLAEMKIIRIVIVEDGYGLTIKYGGYPTYSKKRKGYSYLTFISDLKNIKLKQ